MVGRTAKELVELGTNELDRAASTHSQGNGRMFVGMHEKLAYLEYTTSSSRSEACPDERPSSSTGIEVCIRGPDEW